MTFLVIPPGKERKKLRTDLEQNKDGMGNEMRTSELSVTALGPLQKERMPILSCSERITKVSTKEWVCLQLHLAYVAFVDHMQGFGKPDMEKLPYRIGDQDAYAKMLILDSYYCYSNKLFVLKKREKDCSSFAYFVFACYVSILIVHFLLLFLLF